MQNLLGRTFSGDTSPQVVLKWLPGEAANQERDRVVRRIASTDVKSVEALGHLGLKDGHSSGH